MAGMEFEYDEEGGTFYYFLLSFWGLVLIPATYYLWPRRQASDGSEKKRRICNCDPCITKRQKLKSATPWLKAKSGAIKIALIVAWIIFVFIAYKASKVQMDFEEYDPFVELEIERGASNTEIKKAYRKLSLKFHPDRDGGDPKKFMRIAKAHAALTNDESRENWEKYGNPDGPGVTRFGIALPKWIVERENSVLVLAAYGLVFMILMPVIVGVWWYRSIKFSAELVLLDTTRLYCYFFNKTPNMILRRVIMILAASFEFDRFHNSEITERPSDNEDLPKLIKELQNVNEKNKEKPLCYPYSVKARLLIHAHMARQPVPLATLELDKQYILQKTPYLITEMISCVSQLVAGAAAGRFNHMPRLETAENCMKLSQMLVQGLEEKSSPLLQLPHIAPDMLKHFLTRKRHIRSIKELVAMNDHDRRDLLRTLNDKEYDDVMSVCATMPNVKLSVRSEVLDDDDTSITAGSIVTVTATMTRTNLDTLFEYESEVPERDLLDSVVKADEDVDTENMNHVDAADSPVKKPINSWVKPTQRKKVKKGKQKKVKQAYNWKAQAQTAAKSETKEDGSGKEDADAKERVSSKSQKSRPDDSNDEEGSAGSEADESEVDRSESETEQEIKQETKPETKPAPKKEEEDDDDDWMKFQEETKKENSLEAKAKESHPVHCPYFLLDKQEGWWLYVADRRKHLLVTAPVQVCSLKTEEEVLLKFSAPPRTGSYQYSVILRSDSYIDCDQLATVKLDVKEAKVMKDHPQWDISDDEEDKDKDDDDDSDYTDDDDSDDYE